MALKFFYTSINFRFFLFNPNQDRWESRVAIFRQSDGYVFSWFLCDFFSNLIKLLMTFILILTVVNGIKN